MPFHAVAYAASQTNGTTADIAPVPDDVILIQNGHFVFNENRGLLLLKQNIEDYTFSRLITPMYRQISPLVPAVNDPNEESVTRSAYNDYRSNPLTIPRLEELQFESTRAGSGAVNVFALALCQSGVRQQMPSGNVYTMRGTATTAAVALRWTTLTTTWADTLPTGQYAVVGLQVQSATAVAARIIFEGQSDRPGMPSTTSFGTIATDALQPGGMGVFGRFDSWAMPLIQVLCETTDNAHDIRMSFVRVS